MAKCGKLKALSDLQKAVGGRLRAASNRKDKCLPWNRRAQEIDAEIKTLSASSRFLRRKVAMHPERCRVCSGENLKPVSDRFVASGRDRWDPMPGRRR